MYFRFNLLTYRVAKIFVKKTNSQTNEKSQWCHIFKNGGSKLIKCRLPLGKKAFNAPINGQTGGGISTFATIMLRATYSLHTKKSCRLGQGFGQTLGAQIINNF
jgi:hypothetical protein